MIEADRIDALDGTPLLDIKSYVPGHGLGIRGQDAGLGESEMYATRRHRMKRIGLVSPCSRQQDGVYAEDCIQGIREKLERASG